MASRDSRTLRRWFFDLAVPNILSNVTVPLVGLVDTAILGHLPDIRFLGGVALGSVIFDYAYWSFGFLRMGTTGLTAQAVGREEADEVFQILYRSLLAALGIAAVLLLTRGWIRDLGFVLLSGGPDVQAAGRSYFDARIWGAPATLSNYVLIGWLLGRERAREALLMTAVGNLANAFLDWVFIVQMGFAAGGAGAATAASQYLMSAVGLAIVIGRVGRKPIQWPAVLDRERLLDLVRLNREILVRTLCLMSAFALFTNFSAVFGATVLAANTILFRLQMMASYLIDGAAFATESLAGIYRGRGDVTGLRRLLRVAMLTGAAFAVPIPLAMLVFPDAVFGLLTSHADVIAVSWTFAPWQAAVVVIGSAAFIYDGFFIGLTEGRLLRNQMLVSTLIFFLPLALAALVLESNHLLWAAMTSFMIGRTLTLALGERRVLSRLAQESAA